MKSKKLKRITRELWWTVILSGVLSIVFGLMAIFWPSLILSTLVTIFGIFVIITGATGIVESLASIKKDPLWWLSLLFGMAGAGIGVFLLCNPNVAIDIFVMILAIFIFLQVLSDFVVASYAEKEDGRWLWLTTGILGVILGGIIIFFPEVATLAFVWVLGIYALIRGVSALAFAFRVRNKIKKLAKSAKTKK